MKRHQLWLKVKVAKTIALLMKAFRKMRIHTVARIFVMKNYVTMKLVLFEGGSTSQKSKVAIIKPKSKRERLLQTKYITKKSELNRSKKKGSN